MKINIILIIFMLIPVGSAFDISPTNPCPGDNVILTGTANPGEPVRLISSFEMDIPVVNGKYEYVAKNVEIPQKPNKFAFTVGNVKELNLGVKIGMWLSMPVEIVGRTASISRSDVPPGRYSLKMFGEAVEGATFVPIRVKVETISHADQNGKYRLCIDTTGIPEGKYKIQCLGKTKMITIGSPAEKTSGAHSSNKLIDKDAHQSTKSNDVKPVELAGKIDIFEPYYEHHKKADVNNINDLIRYISSIRNKAINMDAFERAAFYEYYLESCGFNASFAYVEDFANCSKDHIWLLVKTRKTEVIKVDPSYWDVGKTSLLPLEDDYSNYDCELVDIYAACDLLGSERMAWWSDGMSFSVPKEKSIYEYEENDIFAEPVQNQSFINKIYDQLNQTIHSLGLNIVFNGTFRIHLELARVRDSTYSYR